MTFVILDDAARERRGYGRHRLKWARRVGHPLPNRSDRTGDGLDVVHWSHPVPPQRVACCGVGAKSLTRLTNAQQHTVRSMTPPTVHYLTYLTLPCKVP